MKNSGLFLVILQLMFVQSHADDWLTPPSACTSTHSAASWASLAPAQPSLPLQYSMKVEANILQNSWTTEVEEHYDNINQRASVSYTRNGSTTISIFNFQTKQRYDVYPNGTCMTRPSQTDFFGFVTRDKQNRPAMATVNEVFRFGTQFNVTYVAKETVRGITVNHWSSCQTWAQLGATFQLDFYFSDPDFTTASGLAQIPVRAVLNGSAYNVDVANNQAKGIHSFQHVYEFTSFRAGPVLNEQVFQIPPGIVCKGRNHSKPLPQIPDQLEISLEVVVPERNIHPRQEYLRYDFKRRLQETVTTDVVNVGSNLDKTHRGKRQENNYNTVDISTSVIKDYNSGLVYATDMSSMACTVQRMSPSMTALRMSHGQNLLALGSNDNQFKYQGQTTFRRMPVDVWAVEEAGVTIEVYFLAQQGLCPYQSMVGMFIKNRTSVGSSNLPKLFQDVFQLEKAPLGYYEDQQRHGSSYSKNPPEATGDQLAWGLQLERLLDQQTTQKVVNIFHYRSLKLDPASFQVLQCFSVQETRRVRLFIMADYDKDVRLNFWEFSNSIRDTLAKTIGVSILHINNLVLVPAKLDGEKLDVTEVAFTLLGAAPVLESKQKNINKAIENLRRSITSGITFVVQYATYDKEFVVHKTLYVLDNDNCQIPGSRNVTLLAGSQALSDKSPESGSSGIKYSPGAVAGIAVANLVVGAILGLGITLLVFRRRIPEEPLVSEEDSI